MRFVSLAAVLAVMCGALSAQDLTLQPVAGTPQRPGDGGPAVAASLLSPTGVSVDASGVVLVADWGHGRIRSVAPDGTISTIAGSDPGSGGDGGPAVAARLSVPAHAVRAPNGDLLIVDAGNRQIRRVDSSGRISAAAGPAISDGTNSSTLIYPRDVAADAAGNLYIVDLAASKVYRVAPDGRGTVFAGTGTIAFYGDGGPAGSATLALPRGVALDGAGNVYIADTSNHRIRQVTRDGTISTIAGAGGPGFLGDGGPATLALLNTPSAVALDTRGNIYIADTGNQRIRRIDARGIITTIAGTDAGGFGGDNGPATAAALNRPQGVAVDQAGNVFIADTDNQRVRKISAAGVITTIAGLDPAAGDRGPGLLAKLSQPSGLALDGNGSLFIADSGNQRIRKVTRDGTITTIAGMGVAGYSGDGGSAVAAQLNNPGGLAIDRSGNLLFADTANHRIRRITPGGTIDTIAGTSEIGNRGDAGPAVGAMLNSPSAVAVDAAGRVYIADSANNRIRVIDAAGYLQPYAGDPAGLPGFLDGEALAAKFDFPRALAFDSTGYLYVADYFNHRIRRVTPGGTRVESFVGGSTGWGAGPPSDLALGFPAGVAVDSGRNVYVADALSDRIYAISATGTLAPIAGSGFEGDSGDGGPALLGTLDTPRDIAVGANGDLYFSDQANNRVRMLTAHAIQIRAVLNAASFAGGAVAPGEIVTVYGSQFTTAGGSVRVSFDGVPAPVLYVSAGQINTVVPVEIAGLTATTLRVDGSDGTSATTVLSVRDTAPGLFLADSSGQAAALNQDNSTNSASSPAEHGTIVQLFGTGGGLLNRVFGDAAPLAHPVTVFFGGIPAVVQYAGSSPGSTGMFQINAVIPSNILPRDRIAVDVLVGGVPAQRGVTIAVR